MLPVTIKKWQWVLLFALLVFFSYANQLIFRYQVPPGGDAINHNLFSLAILQGKWEGVLSYHFLWHLLVAGVAKLTGVATITVMAWLGPLLLVSGSLTLCLFNRRYFGAIAGITSLLLLGFFSRQPLQTLYDGGFPNVLAAATVLPLTIMALETIFTASKKIGAVLIFLVSLLALLYSHHLTTLYALAFLAVYMVIQFVLWEKRRGIHWFFILLTPFVCFAAFLIVAGFLLHSSGTSAESLAKQFMAIDWQWPFIHFTAQVNDPHQIFTIADYPHALGEAVTYLGLAGIPVATAYFIRSSDSPKGRISLVLLLWFTLLAVASQNPRLGFPSRLLRDLAIPLALLGGVFVQAVYNFFVDRGLPKWLWVIFFLFALATGWETLIVRTIDNFSPNPLIYHLKVDSEMADWINHNIPPQSKILVFQDNGYLPLFTPDQKVVATGNETARAQVTDPAKVTKVYPGTQYVYFEYRLDRPVSWDNNRSNLESYQGSPLMDLRMSFAQKEKEVYLFQIINPNDDKTVTP